MGSCSQRWHVVVLPDHGRVVQKRRHVSQLNRDGVDNLLDVPALDSVGFAVDCGRDKAWRVITPQGKALVIGEFTGSWFEPEVSVNDTAHSLVMFLKEMLGVEPKDATFDEKAKLAAEKAEFALGGRNGRIKGLLDMEECRPQRNASKASGASECEGAKSTERGSIEECSPSGSKNQGVGTTT